MDRNAPDPHLRAALRHAPDARLQASPALGAQILAAARRAALEPPPRAAVTRVAWWRRWWPAGGPPLRLGASGAVASVLLAGVIGLVWQAGTPDAVRERSVEPAASTAPPSPPSPPDAARATTAGPEPALLAAATPADARTSQERAARPAASTAAPALPLAAAPRTAAAPPAVAAEKAELAKSKSATGSAAPMPAAPMPAAPIPAVSELPMAAAPAAPATASPAPPAEPAEPAAPSPAPLQAAPLPSARTAGMQRPQAAAAPRPQPAAAPSLPLGDTLVASERRQALAGAAPSDSRVPPWSDALAGPAEGGALVWTVEGHALTPARSWLATLGRMAAPWRPVEPSTPAPGEHEILWWRGGQPAGRLLLGAQALRWCDADLSCQEAPWTGADAARAWQTLPR